jgi:hypothetical protein
VLAERELLELTLRGAVEVLAELLAMAEPEAFSRAAKLRLLAEAGAAATGCADDWRLPIAAALSQIGCIAIPEHVIRSVEAGGELAADEAAMFAAHPRSRGRCSSGSRGSATSRPGSGASRWTRPRHRPARRPPRWRSPARRRSCGPTRRPGRRAAPRTGCRRRVPAAAGARADRGGGRAGAGRRRPRGAGARRRRGHGAGAGRRDPDRDGAGPQGRARDADARAADPQLRRSVGVVEPITVLAGQALEAASPDG